MVKSPHETHHRVFRETPQLFRRAFDILGLPDPGDAEVTVVDCDVTEIQPIERRVDTLLHLKCADGRAYPLIIEAQSKKDPEKALSWAYYLSFLANKYKSHRAMLLVVCRDKVTADWAAGPFALGLPERPNLFVAPHVLGPDNVPVITDPTRAAADLPLAVFSALTHSADDRIGEILEALASALKQTSNDDDVTLYSELTASGLGDSPAADLWRHLMSTGLFDFRGFVAEGLRDEGREEGRRLEKVAVLRRLMDAREMAFSEETWRRIASCEDLELLDLWFDRALTATTAAEVFDTPSGDSDHPSRPLDGPTTPRPDR